MAHAAAEAHRLCLFLLLCGLKLNALVLDLLVIGSDLLLNDLDLLLRQVHLLIQRGLLLNDAGLLARRLLMVFCCSFCLACSSLRCCVS